MKPSSIKERRQKSTKAIKTKYLIKGKKKQSFFTNYRLQVNQTKRKLVAKLNKQSFLITILCKCQDD